MKIYARQIAPEHQESPLFYDDMFPDNIIVSGNRNYKARTIPAFDQINRYFDEMAPVVVNLTGTIFIIPLRNGAPKQ